MVVPAVIDSFQIEHHPILIWPITRSDKSFLISFSQANIDKACVNSKTILFFQMKIAQSGDENEGHMNYQKTLSEAMQFHAERIFSYQEKPKPALESHRNPFCTIHSTPKSQMSTKNGSREIPQTSEDTLDAPEFINDYCT